MYKITLENKKTKEVINYNDVADLNNGEKLFYKFQLNVSQLEDGEYTLSLYEDDNLILTDTLCVGDFSVSGLQYKKSEDIYIETKLESKTEDKEIAVFDIDTIVTPSEGYDAMTSVTIIAKPVFAEGYRRGQTEGYENGIRTQKEKLESIEITANGVYSKEDGYNNIVVEVQDLNGSYDEGYDAGYGEGFEEGANEQKAKLTSIDITKNGTYTNEDGYNEVNVSVEGVVDPTEYSLSFGTSTFTTLPSVFLLPSRIDTDKIFGMFNNCKNLTDISCFEGVEEFYWTKVLYGTQEVFNQTFNGCEKLEDISPLRNIRLNVDNTNLTDSIETVKFAFNYAFKGTAVMDFTPLNNLFDNITVDYTFDVDTEAFASNTIKRFELDWDWSKCATYYQMLKNSKTIEYIQELDATSVTGGYNPLDILYITSGTADALTYFGGFRNQKWSITSGYFLAKCPNLTYDSCISILNNLYDFAGNSVTPTASQGKLKVHSNFLSLVGDEISIGTNKGWTITA